MDHFKKHENHILQKRTKQLPILPLIDNSAFREAT